MNPRPAACKTAALPLSYTPKMEPNVGLAPTQPGTQPSPRARAIRHKLMFPIGKIWRRGAPRRPRSSRSVNFGASERTRTSPPFRAPPSQDGASTASPRWHWSPTQGSHLPAASATPVLEAGASTSSASRGSWLVPAEGLAPSRPFGHYVLNVARLLLRHAGMYSWRIRWDSHPRCAWKQTD